MKNFHSIATLLAIGTTVVLAGCAGSPAKPDGTVAATITPSTVAANKTTHPPGYTREDRNGKVYWCHQEASTGSHMLNKVCMTDEEMAQEAAQSQENMQLMDRRPTGGGPSH